MQQDLGKTGPHLIARQATDALLDHLEQPQKHLQHHRDKARVRSSTGTPEGAEERARQGMADYSSHARTRMRTYTYTHTHAHRYERAQTFTHTYTQAHKYKGAQTRMHKTLTSGGKLWPMREQEDRSHTALLAAARPCTAHGRSAGCAYFPHLCGSFKELGAPASLTGSPGSHSYWGCTRAVAQGQRPSMPQL